MIVYYKMKLEDEIIFWYISKNYQKMKFKETIRFIVAAKPVTYLF